MPICTSPLTDNYASSPPLNFLQARCPSCCPTNRVKALKANILSKCQHYVKPKNTHTTTTTTTVLRPPLRTLSGTTRMKWYQEGKTNLDLLEQRDSELQWQCHQLGHMQICTSPQTDNHTSIPPFSFYRPVALPAAQPTTSKHTQSKHTLYLPFASENVRPESSCINYQKAKTHNGNRFNTIHTIKYVHCCTGSTSSHSTFMQQ